VSDITLRTSRLVLAMPRPDDAAAVHAHCQDPELQRYTTVPVPYTTLDAETFVGEYVPQSWHAGTEYVYGIRLREDTALMGVVAWQRERGAIGYWLGAQYRGRGVMTEAVSGLLDWVFSHDIVDELHWEAHAGNIGSAIVAQRAGFRWNGEGPCAVVGRDGLHPWGWHAALRRQDHASELPAEPWPVPA